MTALREAAVRIGDWAGHDTRFTRFRGDGWQIYLEKPELTLRAMLMLVALLGARQTGLQTRISMAIEQYDHLGSTGLSGASGKAFILSGSGLDGMASSQTMTYLGATGERTLWRRAVLTLAHHSARRWSREQAEAMVAALAPAPPTQDQIAKDIKITRQAVQSRLRSAGLVVLAPALAAFEASMS